MSLVNRIPIGKESPNVINCIIEIPKDTNAKYEYDEALDIFRLNRCLYSSMRYTSSYGFIPQTFALDDDPLDIVIYNNIPIPDRHARGGQTDRRAGHNRQRR